MAAKKRGRNSTARKASLGFSVLEMLLTVFLLTLVIGVFITSNTIVYQLNSVAQYNQNVLYKGQYLYWLFNNEITNNIGIKNFEALLDEQGVNNNIITTSITEWFSLHNNSTIEILRSELSNIEKLKTYHIIPGSDVIKIIKYNLNETLRIDTEQIIYFVANIFDKKAVSTLCDSTEYKQYSALYRMTNNRVEQLMLDITNMQITKVANNAHYSYKFEFSLAKFGKKQDRIRFIIEESGI